MLAREAPGKHYSSDKIMTKGDIKSKKGFLVWHTSCGNQSRVLRSFESVKRTEVR